MDKRVRDISELAESLSIPTSPVFVYVNVPAQRLYFFKEGVLKREYTVSTSTAPPSCVEDSAGTPDGFHRVEQKIGGDAKAGTVFFSRVSTDQFFWDFSEEMQEKNLITSRILWLRGLEPGKNSGAGIDTFQRYVYIHGTNHEDRLGTPATGGCIVMGNEDIIRFYDLVPTGSTVYIDLEEQER